jgi:hypothetical protein
MAAKNRDETPSNMIHDQSSSIFDAVENSVFSEPSSLPRQYKLSMYTPAGEIRQDISRAVVMEVGRLWGDIAKAIASTRWLTVDDICEKVAEQERRNPRRSSTRTRDEVVEGVRQLVEFGVMSTR